MDIFWWLLLGALLTGYFVLGGYDYGAQMLTPVVGRRDRGRRSVLTAVGPFVLGNEVWLVAVLGVLFGAFPLFEGVLLVGLFPLVVPLVLALVVGNAAVQLRSRFTSPASRRLGDLLVVLGGAVPAVLWGVIVAVLLRGVDRRADGYFLLGPADVFHPFVLLCGLATATVFLAHGACFLAVRGAGDLGRRARRVARTVVPAATVAVLAAGGVGALTGIAAPGTGAALAGVGVVVVALVVAAVAGRSGSERTAFGATAVAAAGPVVLVGLAQFPYLLVASDGESLAIAAGAADPATLVVLAAVAAFALPLVAGIQLWSWRVMSGRVDESTPAHQ